MTRTILAALTALVVAAVAIAQNPPANVRPRASDLGLKVGILPTGPVDAISDVAGVEVGHMTIIRGSDVRTGVTAILPHAGNLFREKVPGAVLVGNAFGKLAGSTQVNELGEIETPILLTSTLSVPRAALHPLLIVVSSRHANQTDDWRPGNALTASPLLLGD